MKVSVALHSREPADGGNQRQYETWYGGYNRMIADLVIDPETGNGVCEFKKMAFPRVNTDPETFTHFSLGEAHAPNGFGGSIIIVGPVAKPVTMQTGEQPTIDHAACGVYAHKLQALGCIKQDADGKWVELTEHELRSRPISIRS